MAHKYQLEKDKYRQWVKAGLGLGFLKEGLVPFCSDIADQQYKDILQNIRSAKSLPSTVICSSCQIETLKPDHKPVGNAGNKVCPLGQIKCSCCFKGKIACPNNICGAIYDFIVQHHASLPPAPNWKNSNAQQWSVDPWSICKCFINAPGYEQNQSAGETDCTGLLHLLMNNQYFHSHIGCNATGTNNVFAKVRQYRNDIFHSSSMELKESEANSYIDGMIAVLQDSKELLQRSDSQIAVTKLQDLKKKDFIITTEGFEDILRQIKDEMEKVLKLTKNAPTKEEYEELENKLETQMSKLKEEIKRLKVEDSPQQKQIEYETAKTEWRKKLIEQYHKTLLQVPTILSQPKSEKCSFKEIYIRPKITREIKGERGETDEEEVKTMSEILKKNGVPQKSVYVLGDAGSGKTSFCKYIVNCWCLAHSEEHGHEDGNEEHGDGKRKQGGDNEEHGDENNEHEAGNENEGSSGKHGGNVENEELNDNYRDDNDENEKHGGFDVNSGGKEEHVEHESDIVNVDVNNKHSKDIINEEVNKEHGGNIEHEDDSTKHGDVNEIQGDEKHVDDIEKHKSDYYDIQQENENGLDFDLYTDDSDDDLTDSEFDSKSYELKFNGVKEMKIFDFLFYIPLRQYQNEDTIDEMLHKRYQMKMLSTLLEEESSSIMILLDGLDEWSSENVPEHSIFKEYTVVTTSRPWKFHALRSSDVEIEQILKLKGFDVRCEMEIVYRTVSQLNLSRHAKKEVRDCRKKIKEKALKRLKQVPIMLKHLIYLWFDGKLDKTSRCAIYTGMLELFFTWNGMKTTERSTRLIRGTKTADLPQYLTNQTILRLNRHFIYEVSQLAYETLFNCPKDKSLTFDISMFDELDISDEVRENCLKLGIMTEDECLSLSVSEPQYSLFSFIHKSMQEFLTAVNISISFNAKVGSSGSTGIVELSKCGMQFINEVFQKCSTVNDILEQSNVVIMLSGLEPRVATHVSKYIYDTVLEDSRVQEYRRTVTGNDYIPFYFRYIHVIQKLIFESMRECNASCIVGSGPVFYIADLVIDTDNCNIVCSSFDQKQIAPDSVLSISVYDINTTNVKFTKYLPMLHYLKKIDISYDYELPIASSIQSDSTQNINQSIDEINNCVSETVKVNTLTLNSLSLSIAGDCDNDEYYPMVKTVFSYLPKVINLAAISMREMTISHDETTTFCNFLEGTSLLKQIHLVCFQCECANQHNVNLSKQQKLQYLQLEDAVSVIDVDGTNLETFIFNDLKARNYEKIFDTLRKAYKLKELELSGEVGNKSQLYHTNITKSLVMVLPFLHNLSKLELHECRLTDNIIQLPLEMKSLKEIMLVNVKMSLTTCQKFFDSLLCIPHTVDVLVEWCYISEDGEEMLHLISQGVDGGNGNDVLTLKHLKDPDNLFHIKFEDDSLFNVSTKK